jgi:NADP-dependent 3-hydroxy acid dehydrogenase YdfG
MANPICAVVGVGPKNGAAFATRFNNAGYRLALLLRSTEYSEELASSLNDAKSYVCDASDPASVTSAFSRLQAELGNVDVLIYNAGSGSWQTVDEITPDDFERSWRVTALGALVASQQVIPAMKQRGSGNIIIVGATASLRGRPQTTGFAAAKAAQRSLAQSMAKHLGPSGIHVSLLIIDGSIAAAGSAEAGRGERLDPRDIAELAHYLTTQPQSAWSFEVDVRPSKETW